MRWSDLSRRTVWAAVAAVLVTTGVTGLVIAPPASAAVTSHPGIYHPLTPARVLDTTATAGGTVSFTALGQQGVPASGVGAVVVNVTVATPAHGGYVTVFPFGAARPTTSNLNFVAGRTVANLVVVQLGTGGKVSLYNASSGATRVVADVSGYYESGTPVDPGAFHPLAPARVLDTRTGLGAPASSATSQGTASFQVAGVGGVPATGASAVVLNVTVATPQASGFATVFPSGVPRPGTSTLNFPAGRTVPNLVTVKLGADGKVNAYNGSLGSVRFVADVFGYYLDGTPVRPGTFQALTPARIMDTRSGLGVSTIVGAQATVRLSVNSKGGLPPYGGGAVALNVTVTGPKAGGYLTVYPTTAPRPHTSNINYVTGQTVANLVIVRPGDDGNLYFTNSSAGAVHVIADVSGSFAPVSAIHFRGSTPITDTAGGTSISCASETLCLASTISGRISQFDGADWLTPTSIFAGDEAVQIDCPTATFCLALSRLGKSRTFNGTTWSATPVSAGSPAGFGSTTLSCVSSTFCLATGFSDLKPHRFNGSTWSSITSPTTTFVQRLSCTATTFCLLVDDIARAYRYNGSTWSAATQLGDAAAGLSCTSSSFCLYITDGGEFQKYNGTSWSGHLQNSPFGDGGSGSCVSPTFCQFGVDGSISGFDGSVWTFKVGTSDVTQFVDCVSTTFCASVGSDGLARTFDGNAWSGPVGVDPVLGSATAVSCAAAPFCAVATSTGAVVTRGASGWSPAKALQPGVEPTGISCPSSQFCAAIGAGNVQTFDGASWSTPVHLDNADSLSAIACPSATFCMTTNGATYFTYNGTSWSGPTPVVDPVNGVPSGMLSMTCPSAAYCAISRFDGSTSEWTGTPGSYWPAAAPTGLSFPVMSCVSATWCAAADDGGRVKIRTGSTWGPAATIAVAIENFSQITCLSTTFCVTSASNSNNAYTYDGETWNLTTTSPIDLGLMSCGSTSFCLGVNGSVGTVGTPV